MDSSFTVKPRDSVARSAAGRSNIVRTDLSPSQSVNAAQQTSVLHHAPVDPSAREPLIDPQCHSVLEREREERERRRTRKDEVFLRQRAYGRNAEKSESPPQDDDTPHADFQV
jgi:hypothetical protein